MTLTIQTPTPDLAASLSFYEKAGFKAKPSDQPIFTDGNAIVELNSNRFARPGFRLYGVSIPEVTEDISVKTETDEYVLIADPSGVWIYLMKKELPQVDNEDHKSVLGSFAGFSIESIDMEGSIRFWSKFGWEATSGGVEHGWVALTKEGCAAISIMKPNSCPHLFFNPSLTYFNGKENMKIIESIRGKEIPIKEEITHFNPKGVVDNLVLQDPGGIGFFIFSD